MVPGIVENGKIEINQAIPAKNGTPVMIFVIPQHDEISHKQDLFGKWTWYDDDIERERYKMPGITGLIKQILYDSSILIGYLRGNKICKSKIENIQAGKRVGFISVVSVFEIYVGAFLSPKPTDSFKDIREILTYFQSLLDIDDAAAQKAAFLFAQLRRTNETIGLNDLLLRQLL